MVFRAPSKLPFCFAVFKYLLPFSRQAWIIDLRLPKLLYRKRKTLLKIWMLLHSDRCHLSSERLAQKLNHWGCASAFARKSHAPLWGAELGFMTEVLLYSDLVIHWLDCLSDCFSQPSADRLLWDGCYCHSQIICGRNPVFPVSYILLAMDFKCTGTEGKKGWSDWLLSLEKWLPAEWGWILIDWVDTDYRCEDRTSLWESMFDIYLFSKLWEGTFL